MATLLADSKNWNSIYKDAVPESASGLSFVFPAPSNIYIIISKFIQCIMTIYNKRPVKAVTTLVEADDKTSQVFDIIYN